MTCFKLLRARLVDEEGAVTVDWVVLTAAVVGLGAAALTLVRSNTGTLTTKVGDYLASASVNTEF